MKDLIKRILKEETEYKDLIVPYRLEDRDERYKRIIYKKIQDYIKNGSKGDLELTYTPIKSLPSNLKTVGGGLDLHNTKILELPKGLTVNGYLDLSETPIKSLPPGLTVGTWIDLSKTPIETLPEGLTVKHDLLLGDSSIKILPNNLTVEFHLFLYDTQIEQIPKNLHVDGNLWLRNTPLSEYYSGQEIKEQIQERGGYIGGYIHVI